MCARRVAAICSLATMFLTAALSPAGRAQKTNADASHSLPAIRSQAEFDSLAVVYDPNTPYALPHALFVIDRQNKNRVYYEIGRAHV